MADTVQQTHMFDTLDRQLADYVVVVVDLIVVVIAVVVVVALITAHG